jgi:hypothetical protein
MASGLPPGVRNLISGKNWTRSAVEKYTRFGAPPCPLMAVGSYTHKRPSLLPYQLGARVPGRQGRAVSYPPCRHAVAIPIIPCVDLATPFTVRPLPELVKSGSRRSTGDRLGSDRPARHRFRNDGVARSDGKNDVRSSALGPHRAIREHTQSLSTRLTRMAISRRRIPVAALPKAERMGGQGVQYGQ